MTYNHHQIQDLKLTDLEKHIGKIITITFPKPTKLKGFEKEKKEFIGTLLKIGLSANSPHLPVDITVKSLENNLQYDFNLFRIESLGIE